MQICTTVPLHFPKERRRGLIKEDLMREMVTFTGKEIILYCYNMLLLDLMIPNGQSIIHCINTTKPYWVMHWILIYPNLNLISYKYYWMCMHDLKLVGFHVPVQKSVCFCKLFCYIAFFLTWLHKHNAQSDFFKELSAFLLLWARTFTFISRTAAVVNTFIWRIKKSERRFDCSTATFLSPVFIGKCFT